MKAEGAAWEVARYLDICGYVREHSICLRLLSLVFFP